MFHSLRDDMIQTRAHYRTEWNQIAERVIFISVGPFKLERRPLCRINFFINDRQRCN